MKATIKSGGKRVDFTMSRYAAQRVREHAHYHLNEESVFMQAFIMLTEKGVADYVLTQTGDVTFLDEDNNMNYTFVVDDGDIVLKSVFFYSRCTTTGRTKRGWVPQEQFSVLVVGAKVVAAALFRELQPALSF